MSGDLAPAELPTDRLLTRREVEEHFGIGKRWLELSAVRGDGPPFYKIGASVRYRVSDLRDWIAAQRRASTSDTGAEAPDGA